jgi:hypothetical protein
MNVATTNIVALPKRRQTDREEDYSTREQDTLRDKDT